MFWFKLCHLDPYSGIWNVAEPTNQTNQPTNQTTNSNNINNAKLWESFMIPFYLRVTENYF